MVVFHDHGTRYLAKMFNDDWMREKGYVDPKGLTAREIVSVKARTPLVTLETSDPVSRAVHVMSAHDYSQIPVTCDRRIVGAISEASLYAEIVKNPA